MESISQPIKKAHLKNGALQKVTLSRGPLIIWKLMVYIKNNIDGWIQYPRWHKGTTGKRLRGGANDEVPQGDWKVRGNINAKE